MIEKLTSLKDAYKEVVFQLVLHFLVFIFYSFDRHRPSIEWHQLLFYLNYALASFLINYAFLPLFYYKKRYIQFGFWLLVLVAAVILIEELVLEKIFFPDTRGQHFPGVFYSLLDVLPVITILSGFKFAWDALGKQREVEQLRTAVEESELQFLISQVNPHFLFNNLNNLYSYAITDSPQTPKIILELSSVLRYMLYECKEKFVPLSKEIEHLESFTRLNQLQIEERGQVNFKAHNINGGFEIAPLILIVFIENAFKHSQASQTENIKIDIELELTKEGELDFYCKNTFNKTSNTESLSNGIGLENVKKRLNLLYSNLHQLKIRETEHQFEVHLIIQLNPIPAQ